MVSGEYTRPCCLEVGEGAATKNNNLRIKAMYNEQS
jgi:hypothetical protein